MPISFGTGYVGQVGLTHPLLLPPVCLCAPIKGAPHCLAIQIFFTFFFFLKELKLGVVHMLLLTLELGSQRPGGFFGVQG